MISLRKARKIIWEVSPVLSTEKVDLLNSYRRVAGEDIYSRFGIPQFRRAAMDGYAVVSKDTKGASIKKPVIIDVVGEIQAGKVCKKMKVRSGKAIMIMTGAEVPSGADGVVMIEDTEEFFENGKRKLKIFKEIKKGENIAEKGEDLKKGRKIIEKGTFIDSSVLSMIAYLGLDKVKVYKRVEVGIISTGNEIKKPGEILKKGEIYDANTYGIYGQVINAGGIPHILGIARDNYNSLLSLVKKGLKYDIIILSGGVSEGKYDLVVDVFKKSGVEMIFWKVAVKPGKPSFFGKKGKTLVFGLPGYPVSSYLNFENLVKVAIYKMTGRKFPERMKLKAILSEEIKNKGDRDSLIRVVLKYEKDKIFALPYKSQKSGVLSSVVHCDGIILLKKGEVKRKGEDVFVEILEK